MRLGLVFAVLIAVNLYFFYFRGGTSLRELMRTAALARSGEVALPKLADASDPPSARGARRTEAAGDRVVERTLVDNDDIERSFRQDGLSPRQAHRLVDALARVFNLRMVRPGNTYTLRFDDEDGFRSLDYRVSPRLAFHIANGPRGLSATRQEHPLETRIAEVGGTVESSLYDAFRHTDEAAVLVGRLVELFASDADFYTDLHPGDSFRMIVEKRYLGGRFYHYGRVLAAEYHGRTGTFRAFWFQPSDGSPGGYYSEHGENVAKSLLTTPFKYVRSQSKLERHRIRESLSFEHAHPGVDYTAPAGTPVWATASGHVLFAGPRGGSGNCIILAHANGLVSIYTHLSRFAHRLHAGEAVRQEQVIGFAGVNDIGSGPQLRYALTQGGAYVDPLRFRAPREAPLPNRYRVEFADTIAPRLAELAAIDTRAPAPLFARRSSSFR